MKTISSTLSITFFIIFSIVHLPAQIDSMIQVLETGDISDQERIKTHNRCAYYFSNVDSAQFIFHKNKVGTLSNAINDTLGKFLFNSLNIIYYSNLSELDSTEKYIYKNLNQAKLLNGINFYSGSLYELAIFKKNINQIDSALFYAKKSYLLDKVNPKVHPINLNHTINFIGSLYKSQYEYDKALMLYLEADSIANTIDNNERSQYKFDIQADVKTSIASLYKTIGDTSLSINYYHKAIDLSEQSNNQKKLFYSFRGLANIYEKTIPDSCAYFLDKAYLAAKNLGVPRILASINYDLGDYWNELKNELKARRYWEEALEVFTRLGIENSQADLKLRLGKLERDQGNNTKALDYIIDAYNIYDKNNKAYAKFVSLDYKSSVLELLGRDGESLDALKEANYIKDSIDLKKYDTEVRDIQAKYETAKKETLLIQQKAELEKQQSIRNLFMASSIFALLLAFGFWNRSRLSKQVLNQETELNAQKLAQLEKEKKILAMSSMIEGQEAERIRIAKDLHDGIGGLLSTVKAHFSNIQAEVEKVKKMKVYNKTNELIDRASSEVRRISHNLMPGALRLDGLHAAIEQIAEDLNIAHALNVRAEIIGEDEPNDEQIQVYLYRIIQEASNNVIKYAEAENYLIQFSSTENEYHLILEDDGRGFDTKNLAQIKGLGLKSIKSRVEQLQGKLDIDSQLGIGTSLSIHIPK